MTAITRSTGGTLSITTPVPPTSCNLSGLTAGAAIAAGDACYIKTSDGKVYPSSGALVGVASPPLAPALAAALSGGTVDDGTYSVVVTYVNATGETLASEPSVITTKSTSANQSTITVTSPAASTNATKYKVYISAKNGGPRLLQNTTGTNLGTDFVLSAPPVTNTAGVPTSDTSGSRAAAVVDGFALEAFASGDTNVSLWWRVRVAYGSSLSPGSFLYLDGTTAGALNDTASTYGTVRVARVIDATRIEVLRSY
jgi:hypothetical protein